MASQLLASYLHPVMSDEGLLVQLNWNAEKFSPFSHQVQRSVMLSALLLNTGDSEVLVKRQSQKYAGLKGWMLWTGVYASEPDSPSLESCSLCLTQWLMQPCAIYQISWSLSLCGTRKSHLTWDSWTSCNIYERPRRVALSQNHSASREKLRRPRWVACFLPGTKHAGPSRGRVLRQLPQILHAVHLRARVNSPVRLSGRKWCFLRIKDGLSWTL